MEPKQTQIDTGALQLSIAPTHRATIQIKDRAVGDVASCKVQIIVEPVDATPVDFAKAFHDLEATGGHDQNVMAGI